MHYPHLSRSRDPHPHASSSSSLSSTAPSDILPAAPPSNSSQSDIAIDLSRSSIVYSSAPSTFPAKGHRFFAKAVTQRSTSMGQVFSPASIVSPPRPSSPSGGGRFKRAFGRRKKSEDLTSVFTNATGKGKERDSSDHVPPGASTSDLSYTTARSRVTDSSGSRNNKLPNALQAASTKLNVFGRQKTTGGLSPNAPMFSGAPPPPPKEEHSPPPLAVLQTSLRQPRHDANAPLPALPREMQRSPVSATSPAQESRDRLKEDWRKSDATMASHVTIRPGALAGNRSPRPVSLAESSHSGHTIVPVNKRLSALITDSEFNVVEEGPGDHADDDGASLADDEGLVGRTSTRDGPKPRPSRSPSGSIKTRNRRSMSLNVGPGCRSSLVEPVATLPGRPPSSLGLHAQSVNASGQNPSLATSRDNPTLTRAAASGYIAPLNTNGAQQSTGSNIRSRLVPWMSTSASNTPTQMNPSSGLPAQSRQPSGLRQTSVSITGGLAPAAGIAMGLGKRAVERVGRAWGGFGSSSGTSMISQTSSVSSMTSSDQGHALGRTMSKESSAALGGIVKKKRRFGPAPSVSSVTSSSATSEADAFAAVGPELGRRVRGPKRTPSGASVIGGLVFKRDLQTCVAETAIDGLDKVAAQEGVGMKSLEQRMLPALVVRCAQHLLKYGVREEGLFRISGRSSHVAKLRSEFDTGADWDMTECDVCDLDPHAVASIFKTYLRELPESILTMSLIPYFESALAAEDRASRASTESSTDASTKSSAPSHQRSGSSMGLHKAPSLSTLAVPRFAGKRSVSDSLLKALTWLIARMPRENKDLLYTVIELIRETAARSAETKMPLANLLLLFSPTLNMNPGMLRVLCENEDIWRGLPQVPPQGERSAPEAASADSAAQGNDEDEVIDIRATFVTARESTGSVGDGLDASAQASSSRNNTEETTSDDEGESSLHTPEEVPDSSVSGVDVEESLSSRLTTKAGYRTAQVTTDLVLLPPINPVSPVSFGDDSSSFMSALEPQSTSSTRSASLHLAQDVPPLSSSESLTSPSEASEEPQSPHGRSSMDSDIDDDIVEVENVKTNATGSQDSFFLAPSPSDVVDLSLPAAPRRPVINTDLSESPVATPAPAAPVPFPSTSGSTPATPISRRKSFALLSFPSLRSASTSPGPSTTNSPASTSTPPSTWHRPKRPSLHLLLQKVTGTRGSSTPIVGSQPATASVPSLPVYSQTKAASASVPSLATPSPTIESGHSRTLSNVAPKLETTISSSPIKLSFADAAAPPSEQGSTETSPSSAGSLKVPVLNVVVDEDSPSSSGSSRYVRPRAGSCATSLYVTPTGTTPKTPIADLYSQHSRSKSAMSFFNEVEISSWRAKKDDNDSLLPMSRTQSSVSRVSPTPSINLPVEETKDGWAESVLMAAEGPAE